MVQVQPLTFGTFNHPESVDGRHEHVVIDHIYDELFTLDKQSKGESVSPDNQQSNPGDLLPGPD